MQQKSKLTKVLLTVLILGFVIWFGGTILRSAIAFDMFETTTNGLELRQDYSDEKKMHSVYLYGLTASYTDVAFAAALLSCIILFISLRKELRKKGWLLMSFVLFFSVVPVESYLIYCDIRLNMALYWYHVNSFADPAIQDYFLDRFRNLYVATPSGLAFLAALTAVIYIVWKPLDKTGIEAEKAE